MVQGLIGRKVGMSQMFDEAGRFVPVTVLQAGPCVVVGLRSPERHGYLAAQVGLVEHLPGGRLSKPRRGQFEKHGLPAFRHVREFGVIGDQIPAVGDAVSAALFQPSDRVDVIGVSKGKGFQGVIRRHHFRGGAATHGSMFHRAPGSIGASSFPSRTFPGMRAAGHMGHRQVTVKNLRVMRVDEANNLLVVKGAIPGARGTPLVIRRSRHAPAAPPSA
jgi:large subunit ribosomal protein L3